jgi:lauroyl/myristoyl acyltransferase
VSGSVKDRLVTAGFSVAWTLIRRLPPRMSYAVFQRLADRSWRKHGTSVQRLEANLSRVCPDLSEAQVRELSREGMRSYLRYWCDAFRLPAWSREEVTATFRMDHVEILDAAMATGRGVIVALPHMGNWDHAGAWAALRYGHLVTVAERLKPESLFDKFLVYRQSLGMEVHALGTTGILDVLQTRLREGKLLALLADRDLSGSGVPVTFFGHPTKMPPGPARLALETGAVLLTATLWYDGPVAIADIGEPIPVPTEGDQASRIHTMTQQMADVFARGIAEHPQDWHMLQRLWLDQVSRSLAREQEAAA